MQEIGSAVLKTWHNIIGPKLQEVNISPTKSFDKDRDGDNMFPGDMVGIDGDIVIVHGMEHSIIGLGGDHSENELIQVIKGYIDKTSSNGHEWVTESGLQRDFGIESKVTPLGDMKAFYESRGKQLDRETVQKGGLLGKLKAVGKLLSAEVGDNIDLIKSTTYAQNPEIFKIMDTARKKIEGTSNKFLRFQELKNIAEMPQPLDMEIGLVNTSNGNLDKLNIVIDRSYEQARLTREHLQQLHNKQEIRKSITMHVLCGDLHRSQVIYF